MGGGWPTVMSETRFGAHVGGPMLIGALTFAYLHRHQTHQTLGREVTVLEWSAIAVRAAA